MINNSTAVTAVGISEGDVHRAARTLLASYYRMQAAERPIDQKITRAEFNGMCRVVCALDFAMTPDGVWHYVQKSINEFSAPRPPFNAGNNRAQKAHDLAVTNRITAALIAGR